MGEESFAAGLVGIVLDERYRLDALLGEGGMGAVFRATQLVNDRRVAVKLLKPHLTKDDTALERFAREARTTLRVDSPHTVKVLDFGITPPGARRDYYIVLEYLDGRTVQRELDVDGPFAPARVVHVACQALEALAAAHREGLVHRDIKPDNILLMRIGDDGDYAKLLDFGVAKLLDGAARSDRSALAITQQGVVFGTPEFMSPEQACGLPLDGRSDLYSLAATMFAMLTGHGLFTGQTPLEWLMHHARTPPPHLADVSPELAPHRELDMLLQRCLAKQRTARPASADDLAAELVRLAPALAGASASSSPSLPLSEHASVGDAVAVGVSGYVEPLAQETLLPQLGVGVAEPNRDVHEAPTTGELVRSVKRLPTLALVVGAVAIVAAFAVAIALAVRGDTRQDRAAIASASAHDVPAKDASAATNIPPTIDAAPTTVALAAPTDAAGPPAATAMPTTAAHVVELHRDPGRKPDAAPNPEIVRHLAAAEDAQRTGNHLRQIAEADAVLRVDAHNVRARVLIADGLIATGSVDSGCKYLRGLTRVAGAQALASSAHCPTD